MSRAFVDDTFADLAAQGVEIDRMGAAYADRAFPALATLSGRDAFSLGFSCGVEAMTRLLPQFIAGVIDEREMMARLYDPDVLPLPGTPNSRR